jgi:hypothetical protein
MPVSEYMLLRQYDSHEPLSITYALDRLFAVQRCEYLAAHGVRHGADELLVFDPPTQEAINARILAGLRCMGFR